MKLLVKRFVRTLASRLGYKVKRIHRPELDPTLSPMEKRIVAKVKINTMTTTNSVVNLVQSVKYALDRNIKGSFVECGVWRGGSAQAILLTCIEMDSTSRRIHLFDTFEGYSQVGSKDVEISTNLSADSLISADPNNYLCAANLSYVQNVMFSTNYPRENIIYHVGDVLHEVPKSDIQEIALLRLDTDYYESTKIEMEYFWPRLSTGGVLIVDDYDHWSGSRTAIDEYFELHEIKPFLIRMESGRIMIKN